MKKLLFLLSLVVLSSCTNDLNTAIKLREGDKRFTETECCIVVEKCTGFNVLHEAFWEYEKIIPKDSIKHIYIGD